VLWKRKRPFNLAGIERDSLVFCVLTELHRPLSTTVTYFFTEFESPDITSAPEIGTVAMLRQCSRVQKCEDSFNYVLFKLSFHKKLLILVGMLVRVGQNVSVQLADRIVY